MAKKRLDVLLYEKGYFDSRQKAKRAVMAGVVYIDNKREDKSGVRFDENCDIYVKENVHPYVGRGGLKLEKALNVFNTDVDGKTVVDIGASTGGFTDCLLKNGAVKVTAIDVGYGQLAWKLRQDERVKVMERTNIRYVKPDDIGEPVDIVCVDVSFISLRLVLPVAGTLLKEGGEIICLIKPQFEAGRDKVGKKGVVREAAIHREVLKNIVFFSIKNDFRVIALNYSPIQGPEGNIEYLMHLEKTANKLHENSFYEKMIDKTVQTAHNDFNDNVTRDGSLSHKKNT